MKRFAASSALFGALFIFTGCTISVAQQPASDETIPSAELPSAELPSAEPSPAPASAQNTAPAEVMIVEKPASECKDLADKACKTKKAEAEPPSMATRTVETRRKAEPKRKVAEQRKSKAAALRRLTEERNAQEARLADAARVANEAEEKQLADKFKRAFERGRSGWLNAQ